ncbi:hypothetical protein CPBF1521_32340 [Xanthomonas arboricola pv. juglandis]|nr:hypothetical protein CPBF1521_32340 [Xanthomonas arboricola pv. juglandis]
MLNTKLSPSRTTETSPVEMPSPMRIASRLPAVQSLVDDEIVTRATSEDVDVVAEATVKGIVACTTV